MSLKKANPNYLRGEKTIEVIPNFFLKIVSPKDKNTHPLLVKVTYNNCKGGYRYVGRWEIPEKETFSTENEEMTVEKAIKEWDKFGHCNCEIAGYLENYLDKRFKNIEQ